MSRRSARLEACAVMIVWITTVFSPATGWAKSLYAYHDDRGVTVLTDQYEQIPIQYRGHVRALAEEDPPQQAVPLVRSLTDSIRSFFRSGTVEIQGLSPYQSRIILYAGLIALICLFAMNMSRSQVIRFLGLWALILVAVTTPVLLYVSQDGPADLMRGKASQIQDKQLERLRSAQ